MQFPVKWGNTCLLDFDSVIRIVRKAVLVSVLVPTRNRPHLLAVALEAIAKQTYREMEIIVIDDGSSPESAQANEDCLNATGSHAIHYLYLPGDNPMGNGPSYSRNVGISHAKGALVAFCDDDDFWCSDSHVEDTVALFVSDRELDLVFANQSVFKSGKITRDIWLPDLVSKLAMGAAEVNRLVTKSDCLLFPGDFAHINTCIYRRDFLTKIDGFWEGTRYASDLDLFVRAIDSARNVMYRQQTVSVHNAPDKNQMSNVSTRLPETEKQMALVGIAGHLIQTCMHPAAQNYANVLAGGTCRSLTQSLVRRKSYLAAFTCSKLALAWKPTFKWALYVMYLRVMSLTPRPRQGS